MLLKPALKCIYCDAVDVPLSDEHVVPFSLGGTWILPEASCNVCAKITSLFERDISRKTYLPLRTKARFPTYHPKKRPKFFDIILIKLDGTRTKEKIPTVKYPTLYPLLHLPQPGILTGAALRNTSPEMRLELVGNQEELNALGVAFPDAVGFEFSSQISWESLCRVLAKIAHSFTVGHCGDVGYLQLLPSLILGDYPYMSNLVGGTVDIQESCVRRSSDGLALAVDPDGHIVVNINIMGGRFPTYSVVSGKVTDWSQFMTNVVHLSREGKPKYSHGMRTRFGFNHDWAIEIVQSIRGIVERDFPHFLETWPLINGFNFDAYALPPSHVLLVLKNNPDPVPSGPDGHIALTVNDHPCLPPQTEDLGIWREWFQHHLVVMPDQWPLIVPVRDSGKSSANADYELFSDIDKHFWDTQWQHLIDSQFRHMTNRIQLVDPMNQVEQA